MASAGSGVGASSARSIVAVVLDAAPAHRRGPAPGADAHPDTRHPDIALRDRLQASIDLRDEGVFAPHGQEGPFVLYLSIRQGRIVLDVRDEEHRTLCRLSLPLSRFRSTIKDYRFLLDAFQAARVERETARMQAIDMGRRALHDEGATLMIEALRQEAELDFRTARRLFTLVCLLHA